MKSDYANLKTAELLEEAEAIARVLKERLSKDKTEKEEYEKIEGLISVFNLDGIRNRCSLEIGEYGNSFFVKWNTPDGISYRSYRSHEDALGIPDAKLLNRAPARWLENLLLGVYNVTLESL